MDIFRTIAERKIEAAIRRGEFDNLPLKGRKLDLDKDIHGPPELRMGFKILKNAGVLPEELSLERDVHSLRDLIACCSDPTELSELDRKLRAKMLQLNMLMEQRGHSPALQDYLDRLDRNEKVL